MDATKAAVLLELDETLKKNKTAPGFFWWSAHLRFTPD